jgi:hypothetical protein
MTWKLDAVDAATKDTTESPVSFCSVNYTSAAAHTRVFLSNVFLNVVWPLKFVITNTGCLFVQILKTYSQTEQKYNRHTWKEAPSISVSHPPTMRPSSLGFIELKGTPEILTNIFIKNYIICISFVNINSWIIVCACFYIFSVSLQRFWPIRFLLWRVWEN